MKVAAVQFAPVFQDMRGNIAAMSALVREAAKAGAQLVVLPELATTGYSFQSEEEALPYAEVIAGWLQDERPTASMSAMWALIQKLDVAIAWGVVERDYGSGELYNTQVLMVPGAHFWSYRKVNRWANDYIWAKEGQGSPPVGQFRGKKIGLLICRDVRDKGSSFTDFYEPGDADIVAFSANWGDGGFPSGNWVKFAKDNACTLVVSNRFGQERNNNFGEGGICIVEPGGKIHCSGLKWSEPCIVYADVG